jgi:hypothetical protein
MDRVVLGSLLHLFHDVRLMELVMGYQLSSLASLPIDDNVNFYVFVINGQYQEPLYGIVQQNFASIARSIGRNAVIAQGLNPAIFTEELAAKYLGNNFEAYSRFLPALLITDAHPDRVTSKSLRLFVPLREAEQRFGGWPQFFKLLAEFARGESDQFARQFKEKEDWLKDVNDALEIKPGIFGFAVNLNALIALAAKRRQRASRPPYA